MSTDNRLPVDHLAQEIRRVDGNHDLGAGALAEALTPFLEAWLAEAWEQGMTDAKLQALGIRTSVRNPYLEDE